MHSPLTDFISQTKETITSAISFGSNNLPEGVRSLYLSKYLLGKFLVKFVFNKPGATAFTLNFPLNCFERDFVKLRTPA